MSYRQMRQWGIVLIFGAAFLSGCAGATPTPAILVPAVAPTSEPPQPPTAQPIPTEIPATNTAQPPASSPVAGADLTTTVEGSVTATVVLATVDPLEQPFLMRIDRVSVIVGRGTLLEGRVAHGTLQANGSVEILGPQRAALTTAILGLFISNTQQDQVNVGDYAGILVQSLEASEVSPGLLLTEAGSYDSYDEALQQLQ